MLSELGQIITLFGKQQWEKSIVNNPRGDHL